MAHTPKLQQVVPINNLTLSPRLMLLELYPPPLLRSLLAEVAPLSFLTGFEHLMLASVVVPLAWGADSHSVQSLRYRVYNTVQSLVYSWYRVYRVYRRVYRICSMCVFRLE